MADTSHMSVTPHDHAAIAIIKCEKVGAREAQILETELKEAAAKRKWRLVVDLAEVTMLASMGLGMLVTMHKECNAQGGKLAICGLRADIHQLLKVTHLDRVFKVLPDQAAATKAVT